MFFFFFSFPVRCRELVGREELHMCLAPALYPVSFDQWVVVALRLRASARCDTRRDHPHMEFPRVPHGSYRESYPTRTTHTLSGKGRRRENALSTCHGAVPQRHPCWWTRANRYFAIALQTATAQSLETRRGPVRNGWPVLHTRGCSETLCAPPGSESKRHPPCLSTRTHPRRRGCTGTASRYPPFPSLSGRPSATGRRPPDLKAATARCGATCASAATAFVTHRMNHARPLAKKTSPRSMTESRRAAHTAKKRRR